MRRRALAPYSAWRVSGGYQSNNGAKISANRCRKHWPAMQTPENGYSADKSQQNVATRLSHHIPKGETLASCNEVKVRCGPDSVQPHPGPFSPRNTR
jgi:hypothetical protein